MLATHVLRIEVDQNALDGGLHSRGQRLQGSVVVHELDAAGVVFRDNCIAQSNVTIIQTLLVIGVRYLTNIWAA